MEIISPHHRHNIKFSEALLTSGSRLHNHGSLQGQHRGWRQEGPGEPGPGEEPLVTIHIPAKKNCTRMYSLGGTRTSGGATGGTGTNTGTWSVNTPRRRWGCTTCTMESSGLSSSQISAGNLRFDFTASDRQTGFNYFFNLRK